MGKLLSQYDVVKYYFSHVRTTKWSGQRRSFM